MWHASPGMGEQPGFLGEVRVTLKGLQKQPTSTTTAWYTLLLVNVAFHGFSHRHNLNKLFYFAQVFFTT